MAVLQTDVDKQKFFEHLNRLDQSDSDGDGNRDSDEDERTSLNPTPKRKRVEIDADDDDEVQIISVQPLSKTRLQSKRNVPEQAASIAASSKMPNATASAKTSVSTRSATKVQQSTSKGQSSARSTASDFNPRFFRLNASETTDLRNDERTASLSEFSGFNPQPAQSSSVKTPSSTKPAKPSSRKAKTKLELELLPEAERIFKELTFYFIPNNDVAPSRKRRIQASIARGATWSRQYNDEVTHVIVDQDITFDTVARGFPENEIPPDVVLIRDTWLTDSIRYKSVQDVSSSRFQLKGAPKADNERKKQVGQQSPTLPASHRRLQKRSASEIRDLTGGRPLKRKPLELQDTPSTPEEEEQERASDELDAAVDEVLNTDSAVIAKIAETASDIESSPFLGSEVPETSSESEEEPNDNLSKQTPTSQTKKKNKQKKDEKEGEGRKKDQGFQCMHKHDGSASDENNPNARTIEMLQKMATYYDRTGDSWRTLAYRKAIGALRQQTSTFIATKAQALTIPQIGERLADKIEEIVTTDRLRRYESTLDDPADQALQLFMGIYDVGIKQASTWIAQGHRTLEDLLGMDKDKNNDVHLTANQRVGIAHYTDFNARIPRAEVAQHGEIVLQALRAVDFHYEIVIGGSYRRKAPDSGDIDIIVTKPNTSLSELRRQVLTLVLPELQRTGFIKATLSSSSAGADHGSKWHGASCLPGNSTWRRLDLLLVPWTERGAAMIYFTGNDIFNRSIRLLASKKGMRLNQHGLFKDVVVGKGGKKETEGTLVESESETRIFQALGVPWRPPEHRRC